MASAQTSPPVPSNGIYLIYEDDARRILLALYEEVSYPGCPNSYKHLHKIRTGYAKKRNPRLSGYCLCQQGFSCPWRTHEEHAFWYAAAEFCKFLWIFEKINNFFYLFLGLFNTCHVLESYLLLVFRQKPCLALSKGHCLAAASLHLPHEKYPYAYEKQHGEPRNKYGPPLGLFYWFC